MRDKVPELLDFPDKLKCILDPEVFNKYRIFIFEGGRGSGKTQTVARFILYLCEKIKLKVVGAREQQNSIEDSVYTVFKDLIFNHRLFFDIKKAYIRSIKNDSNIVFKGMREQGAVNIKGMENVDIVWFDEAQAITQTTLDILLPTVRKNDAKLFFTLNRFIRTDPVMSLVGRDDCLHIHIDYFENKFCTEALKVEAAECKARDPKKYKHIWLGEPLETTTEYLFNFNKLAKLPTNKPFGDLFINQSVMSVDLAAGGGDLCVASLGNRTSNVHWKLMNQVAWDNPDTDESVGKIVNLYGEWKPDILIVDAGGMGYPIFCSLSKTIKNIIGFDGSKTDKVDNVAGNNRAQAYFDLKEFVDQEWIECSSQYTNKELETIKKIYQKNGKIYIQSKIDMKKDNIDSPDRADSLAMLVFAIVHYLGRTDFREQEDPIGMRVRRKSGRKKIH